jgi:hypothetical protein
VQTWQRQLGAVQRQMTGGVAAAAAVEPWPEDQRLVYVVDLPGTHTDGGIAVELATERLGKHGAWERPKQLRMGWRQWQQSPDPADRQIAQMLVGARADAGQHFGAPAPRRFVVP